MCLSINLYTVVLKIFNKNRKERKLRRKRNIGKENMEREKMKEQKNKKKGRKKKDNQNRKGKYGRKNLNRKKEKSKTPKINWYQTKPKKKHHSCASLLGQHTTRPPITQSTKI